MKSKKKRMFEHTVKRGSERFGITLTQNDISEILRLINESRSGNCINFVKFLSHESGSRVLLAVKFKETWMPVIFSKKFHQIVTILPESVLDKFRKSHGLLCEVTV